MSTEVLKDRSKSSRLFLSALPAIGLTCGLFYIMQEAITVDTVEFDQPDFRNILSIVLPESELCDCEPPDNSGPILIETAPPPKLRHTEPMTAEQITMEIVPFNTPGTPIPGASLEDFGPTMISFGPETGVPLRQPLPVYPDAALRKGLSGQCDVYFSIDAAGRPFNVDAECSDPVFERSSESAVRKVQFAAKVVDGRPVGQDNLVYPFVYELNGD